MVNISFATGSHGIKALSEHDAARRAAFARRAVVLEAHGRPGVGRPLGPGGLRGGLRGGCARARLLKLEGLLEGLACRIFGKISATFRSFSAVSAPVCCSLFCFMHNMPLILLDAVLMDTGCSFQMKLYRSNFRHIELHLLTFHRMHFDIDRNFVNKA